MLYSEFLKGTKAPENKETYEQFKVIEKIYMDCETMSKSDAYAVWKKTYGKELKVRRKRMLDRAASLLCTMDEYEVLPEPDQRRIGDELERMYWNAWYNRDGSRMRLADNGRCFTDTYGIVWIVKYVGSHPNGSCQYGLFAWVENELVDAHLYH